MTRSSSTRTTETPAGDSFPRELLMQPPAERLAYFAAKVVAESFEFRALKHRERETPARVKPRPHLPLQIAQ